MCAMDGVGPTKDRSRHTKIFRSSPLKKGRGGVEWEANFQQKEGRCTAKSGVLLEDKAKVLQGRKKKEVFRGVFGEKGGKLRNRP